MPKSVLRCGKGGSHRGYQVLLTALRASVRRLTVPRRVGMTMSLHLSWPKAAVWDPMLVCDLFIREPWNPSSLAGMLNGNATNVALPIYIEKGVLVEVSRLNHAISPKLNIKRIGFLKILDLHGVNDRSKNAL